jgi:hypothetical protein
MMLNDPLVMEASRALSQKLVKEQSGSTERITKAFRRIICRKPTAKEMTVLESYYNEQKESFQQKKLDAATTIKAGEYPADKKADVTEMASLMKTILAIYNLEEAITKT